MIVSLDSFNTNQRYCYFSADTGEIIKLTNQIDTDSEHKFIMVSDASVEPILDGSEPFEYYTVQYNFSSAQYEISRKDETNILADEVLYEILHHANADIQITQDTVNKWWYFNISKDLKYTMIAENLLSNKAMYFSVTAPGDPNILYKTLKVQIEDLVKHQCFIIPFTDEFEFSNKPVSIYVSKRFKTYSYNKV